MQRTWFDVAVVGGGSAGIAAAVAAARRGARTLLVERADVLGGNATQACVHTICGLYRPAGEGAPAFANPGLPRHFAERLQRAGAAGAVERAGRVFVLPTHPPRLARVAAELCAATPSLSLWTRCALIGASLARDRAAPHVLQLRGAACGAREIEARIVVDASGDAALAAAGGAEVVQAPPEELQAPSYIFTLHGVDTSAIAGFARLRLTQALAGAVRDGRLPGGCESVLVRRGAAADEVYVTLNVPRPPGSDYDPLDSECLRRLEARAKQSARLVAAFLRDNRPAFEQSRVFAWPERIGIRETRRLRGIATLERDDVLGGRVRDDEVAVSTWPIELWRDHRRAHFEYPKRPCSVPLGALVSRSHPRLGTAGRCVSASHAALGALRVIGTALATGQAVGVAAALAADACSDLSAIAAADVRHHILATDEETAWP
ncbi:MAG: FAD-dependent oxidoreductase [Myxococcales bacterium]|nr:FAD-dependent oxidoreductase [Myxococcales bacterium]